MQATRNNERGIASILTVIFFILIASVIAIGFMRLSLLEGKQALEDSLSKSALAAAHSGVNDAKRALLHCLTYRADPVGTGHPECDGDQPGSIYDQNCPGFFGNATLRTHVGLADPDASGSIKVTTAIDPAAGNPVNERYTCVIITDNTYDVVGPLTTDRADGNTTLVPIRGTTPFTDIRISWHRYLPTTNIDALNYCAVITPCDATNQNRANYRDPNAYGSYFEWAPTWPPLMRMTLFSHPSTGIAYDDATGNVNISEKTSFLYPTKSTATNPALADVNALLPRQMVRCNPNGEYEVNVNAGAQKYLCQTTIRLTGNFTPDTHSLFLQLTNMYTNTEYALELLDSAGQAVRFDSVSPQIDATGAVDTTFRRVQVRLRYDGSTPVLPNAVDTGSGICKDFIIGNDPTTFSEDCGY
jgi:hypothetical protein